MCCQKNVLNPIYIQAKDGEQGKHYLLHISILGLSLRGILAC